MTEQIETALSEKGAFGMGNLRYAYILNALRDWAGDEAEIREVGCQFRAINQKNDVLTVTGTVKEKKVEDGENRVYLDVNVVNQSGSATCPGHAVVVLPAMRGESCAPPPPCVATQDKPGMAPLRPDTLAEIARCRDRRSHSPVPGADGRH